jgi:hypothetical protein
MHSHIDGTPALPTSPTPSTPDATERARQIRARLAGQVLYERLQMARALHGELFTLAELERRVAETLPPRFGSRRTAALEPIETYRDFIPDEALLKYDDAVRSGLFASFRVATPAYRAERQVDPWIVAQVRDADVYAVIAQWG